MDAPKTRARKLHGGGLIVTVPIGAPVHLPYAVLVEIDQHQHAVFALPDSTFNPHEQAESLRMRYQAAKLADRKRERNRERRSDCP